MHRGPLMIPNLSRPHCCSFPQVLDSIGADITLGTYFFNFCQLCSLCAFTGTHPVLSGMAHRSSVVRSTFRCFVSWSLCHAVASLYPDFT